MAHYETTMQKSFLITQVINMMILCGLMSCSKNGSSVEPFSGVAPENSAVSPSETSAPWSSPTSNSQSSKTSDSGCTKAMIVGAGSASGGIDIEALIKDLTKNLPASSTLSDLITQVVQNIPAGGQLPTGGQLPQGASIQEIIEELLKQIQNAGGAGGNLPIPIPGGASLPDMSKMIDELLKALGGLLGPVKVTGCQPTNPIATTEQSFTPDMEMHLERLFEIRQDLTACLTALQIPLDTKGKSKITLTLRQKTAVAACMSQ